MVDEAPNDRIAKLDAEISESRNWLWVLTGIDNKIKVVIGAQNRLLEIRHQNHTPEETKSLVEEEKSKIDSAVFSSEAKDDLALCKTKGSFFHFQLITSAEDALYQYYLAQNSATIPPFTRNDENILRIKTANTKVFISESKSAFRDADDWDKPEDLKRGEWEFLLSYAQMLYTKILIAKHEDIDRQSIINWLNENSPNAILYRYRYLKFEEALLYRELVNESQEAVASLKASYVQRKGLFVDQYGLPSDVYEYLSNNTSKVAHVLANVMK